MIRFSFTFIALNLVKVLFGQYSELSTVINRLKSSSKITKDDFVEKCHGMIKDQIELISLEVISERLYDPQEFIRKQVMESILALDLKELQAAIQIKEVNFMELVFSGLRDESSQLRKLALSILQQVLVKYDQTNISDLTKHFHKHKL